MWLHHLLLLLSIVFLVHGQDECPGIVYEVCEYPTIFHMQFPKFDSELELLCSELKQFAECVMHCKERCPTTAGPSLELAQSFLKTLNTFCMNDTAWFKGVIKYGSCFQNFIGMHERSDICAPAKVNKLNQAWLDVSDQPTFGRCFSAIRATVCVLDKMSRECGKMATELALHFLNGVGFWNVYCLDNKETALALVEKYELTFNPETAEDEFVTLFENTSSSYGSNKEMCLSNYGTICQYPGNFIFDFPEDSANLSARCMAHIKYKECLTDYEQKCGEKIWVLYFYEDLETLNTICNESSVFFHALADKGKCFNKIDRFFGRYAENRLYPCRKEIKNKDQEKYELENQRYPDDYAIKSCFYSLEMIKCLSDVISEECGETAKELMLQALKLNKLQYTSCRAYPKEAELYMEALDFNLDPQHSYEDFILFLENETDLG